MAKGLRVTPSYIDSILDRSKAAAMCACPERRRGLMNGVVYDLLDSLAEEHPEGSSIFKVLSIWENCAFSEDA